MTAELHNLELLGRTANRRGPKIRAIAGKRGPKIRVAWRPKRGQWVGLEMNFEGTLIQAHGRFADYGRARAWVDGINVENLG